jgi:hypothetical protein
MTTPPTQQPAPDASQPHVVRDDYDDGAPETAEWKARGRPTGALGPDTHIIQVRSTLMPLVYVIGPYRAGSEWDLVRNIRAAEEVSLQVWQSGAAAICPHKNTAHFGGAGGAADDVWLEGDIEMMLRCDACVTCGNYHDSKGSQAEIRIARANDIPVFHSVYTLLAWLAPRLKERHEARHKTRTGG